MKNITLPETNISEEMSIKLSRMDDFLEKFDNSKNHEKEIFEEMIRTIPTSIVLYLHGNTASRGAPHRVDLYKVLRKLGYHVIAVDYRGYGDSEPISPTENGVVNDAIAAYRYISNLTKNPIFVWGHSLGTGVATHMLSVLNKNKIPGPKCVVLESPFNNIRDEIKEHPMSQLYKHLPWFDYTISKPMHSNMLRFQSDEHISEFRQPLMILHAEDDLVVPFKLGYKLYRVALDKRGKTWGPVEFHRFSWTKHYGHKYICNAPELPDLVRNFFDTYRNEVF